MAKPSWAENDLSELLSLFYVSDYPAKLLVERKFNKTNVMIGVTKHEGGIFMITTIPGELAPPTGAND